MNVFESILNSKNKYLKQISNASSLSWRENEFLVIDDTHCMYIFRNQHNEFFAVNSTGFHSTTVSTEMFDKMCTVGMCFNVDFSWSPQAILRSYDSIRFCRTKNNEDEDWVPLSKNQKAKIRQRKNRRNPSKMVPWAPKGRSCLALVVVF